MRIDFDIEHEENEISLNRPDGSEVVLKIAMVDLPTLKKIQQLEDRRSVASGAEAVDVLFEELALLSPGVKMGTFAGIPMGRLAQLIEKMIGLATGSEVPDAQKKNTVRRNSRSSRSRKRASA